MPTFETFTRRATPLAAEPRVAIQKRGTISLNRSAFEALGSPAAVELLFDKGEQVVGIRPVPPDVRHSYPLRKQPSSFSYLIAGQAFCNYYGIPTGETRRYAATTIDDVLAIDLKQDAERPITRGQGKPSRENVAA